MSFDVEGLFDLWSGPSGSPEDTRIAFARRYTDPVIINGQPVALADLVRRAAGLQRAFGTLTREIEAIIEAGDRVVISFRMGGRQIGPMATSAGILAPTRQRITLRIIDIFTLRDGLISEVTMVADELSGLAAVGAVSLASEPDSRIGVGSSPNASWTDARRADQTTGVQRSGL